MEEINIKKLRALNHVNQELYKELLPKLLGAKYYHSETEFWSPLMSGISILRTRINAYEFPPLFCEDMSTRLSESNCQEILELQQVEMGKITEDLAENEAKIDEALRVAVSKGKRFSLQTSELRITKQQRLPGNAPEIPEATEEEWEKAERIIEESRLYDIPCVSIRTAKTKEAMVIDEFD